jgi:TonB family protein
MKQFLSVLFLLFICTLCLNNHAAAQDSASTKAKADTVEEEWDIIFVRIPLEGEFRGGDSAWQRYIQQNLVYPKKAKKRKIEGTVTVQFILSKLGDILEAKALSGPEELRKSAVDVIMRSPKWDPAMQSGRQVKAYKKYDIVFKLDSPLIIRKPPSTEKEKPYVYKSFDGFFPGGDSAWKKYIEQHLVYPKKAKRKKIQGVVIVQFIVDKEGNLADVEALTGPEILRQSAVAVVKKSPKWLSRIERKGEGTPPAWCNIVFKLDKK